MFAQALAPAPVRRAALGYISQGSVLDRTTLSPPRRGYQWTRKVGQKTVTVALSRPQYEALKRAVENARTLRRTVAEMERFRDRCSSTPSPTPVVGSACPRKSWA